MPSPDPFDELEDLFADDEAAPAGPPGYIPTRKEAIPSKSVQRTPTRAEALAARTPTRMEATTDDAAPFHPRRRPSMALLCICDDASADGEWIRIRKDKFVIGRTEGDCVIPFDDLIGTRHAEISRSVENGKSIWYLTDLHSPTGTFVAVTERPLKSGNELWLGSRRYRFEQGNDAQLPSLVDLEANQRRFLLDPPAIVLGRHATPGGLAIPDDPSLSRQHARFELVNQQWKVVSLNPRNGVWVRIERVRFPVMCRFQIGEQRFLVRVVS
jgi:pSer/pThr/pTyr-binding forkhead associated (FHA) protein